MRLVACMGNRPGTRRQDIGEAMKAVTLLLIITCALALQACATYSNPYEPAGRIYYDGQVDHDPYAHDVGEPVVEVTFADTAYYPWWSIDYYYLGHHYYRPSYLGGPYYSPGYGFGVPPYYWPYYGYFSPFYYPHAYYAWYDPWYGWPRYGIGTNIFWTNVYWTSRYRAHVEEHYPPPAHDRYGVGRYGYRESQAGALSDARDRAYASERLQQRDVGENSRNVSLSPSTGSTDAGMEVRSRRERKIRQARIGPAPVQSPTTGAPASRNAPVASVQPAPSRSTSPVMSAPNVVRQTRAPQAQTGPAVRAPSPSAPVASNPRVIRQSSAPPTRPGTRPASRPNPVPPGSSPARAPGSSKPVDRHRN